MARKNQNVQRDDFEAKTIEALKHRSAYICSKPNCKALTLAPSTEDNSKYIYNGIAAHITAASRTGPRHDSSLTTEERKSIDNAIFLCSSCATIIDKNNGLDFSVAQLKRWKQDHEDWVAANLGTSIFAASGDLLRPQIEILFQNEESTKILRTISTDEGPKDSQDARSDLAYRSMRVDFVIVNTGVAPAHDIDVFVTFPNSIQVYSDQEFESLWYLAPYDISEDTETYFRKSFERNHKPAMEQIQIGFEYEVFKLTIISDGTPQSRITDKSVVKANFDRHKVNYHLQKLKHNLTAKLDSLYLVFPDREQIKSFVVRYKINANEFPNDIVGVLSVTIS